MATPERPAAKRQEFRKGDKVVRILRGAGVESSEESEVLYVRKGEVWLDNGPGNDPSGPYNPATGKSMADEFFGFTTRIEHA